MPPHLDLKKLEQMWEAQDRWQLMSWGLRQRQGLIFRRHFLNATEHLKDRFRILLGRFLQKRAEKQFQDMMDLIKNFDADQEQPG